MKSLILNNLHQPLTLGEMPDPIPAKGEVIVKLRAAALNHRDIFITKGLYANIKYPCILGSDGAGELRGQRVIIYPAFEWGDNPHYQGKNFRVLGMPDDGTFAEQIRIPGNHVFPAPAHLTWEQAAALPLAGLTAWRVLFSRCNLSKGEKILITGVGGGVALTAFQFALAAQAEVYVTSGNSEKIEKAMHLGAKGGINYREDGWDKRLKQEVGGFDVIIDSAAGNAFSNYPGLCNPGGRIGIYGGSLGKVNGLSMQPVFWKQISVLGSTMGTLDEFQAMLNFVEKHKVAPIVDSVFPLSDSNQAFERMQRGDQFGKIVLAI